MNYWSKIAEPVAKRPLLEPQGVSDEGVFATDQVLPTQPGDSWDPSERLEFSRLPTGPFGRFDLRADGELAQVMFDHPSSMERERAAWEYGDRLGATAARKLNEMAARDADPSVRWGLLWLLQKIGHDRAVDDIMPFLGDEHPEVRDWARLLISEMIGTCEYSDARQATFDGANPFDQTLPLMIAGHARTLIPGLGWVQATLSPQWFESIMGRVMACTCANSFNRDLVIEKRVKEYHPDGSDHYEIYKFRGFTFHPAEGLTHHIYECQSTHTFYPSGKVEDASIAPFGDVGVVLNRVALPVGVPLALFGPQRINPVGQLGTRALPNAIVTSVRGRYMGAAFVNVERLMAKRLTIGPGEVQLASPNHPIVGDLTNTFLTGTFKGKLSDLDGDGALDINTERCHGTLDGKLDYALRGEPNPDPFDALALV